MDLPEEILRLSMRTHQKYLALRHGATGKLADRFAVVTNMVTAEDGAGKSSKAMSACCVHDCRTRNSSGNRIASERSNHACPTLKHVVFHAKLGTQLDRVDRIVALGRRNRAHHRRRCGAGKTSRRTVVQSRSDDRSGRRVSGASRRDGTLLRPPRWRAGSRGERDLRTLQARRSVGQSCRRHRFPSLWRLPTSWTC